jgi:hypothetical protein
MPDVVPKQTHTVNGDSHDDLNCQTTIPIYHAIPSPPTTRLISLLQLAPSFLQLIQNSQGPALIYAEQPINYNRDLRCFHVHRTRSIRAAEQELKIRPLHSRCALLRLSYPAIEELCGLHNVQCHGCGVSEDAGLGGLGEGCGREG